VSKLYFRHGAMNSGKSTALLQAAHNYEERAQHVFLAKPAIDVKGEMAITSRLGVDRNVDFLITPELNLRTEFALRVRQFKQDTGNNIACLLIDEAQLHGVAVHLLADEASRNMNQLNRDDPGWARLLSQADHRVVLGAQALRDGATPRHASTVHAVTAIDPEQLRAQLSTVINTWWADEPEDLREELREELQNTRGIPQEVDRQLLLGVRRVLERALSFQEKKLLREMVRDLVLGPQAATSASAESIHHED
jgi:hypothetical protein